MRHSTGKPTKAEKKRMDAIKAGMAGLGEWVTAHMAEGPLRSLLVGLDADELRQLDRLVARLTEASAQAEHQLRAAAEGVAAR